MKKLHTLVAVVGLAVVSAGAWWYQNRAVPGKSEAVAGVGGQTKVGPGSGASAEQTAGSRGAGGGAADAAKAGRGAGGPGGGPVPVEVAAAETTTLTDDIQAVGSLKSARGVMMRPEVSGRIAKLGFSNGARVQQGQLLVQLDDSLQQAQLLQSEAQANIARTRLARNRELLGQGFVSQSAVDQTLADLQVAEAQVALTQAQIGRMKVFAPFNGTVGLRKVEVGDYVKDGADIVDIQDLGALTVQFAVPERTLDRLRVGQSVDMVMDSLPGRTFKGRVIALDSQVDANGRALQVLAEVNNGGALLKPGMFARPRVVFATRVSTVVVAEEALVPQGNKQFIFKVVDDGTGRKVAQRIEARIGLRLPGKVEMLEGVKAGDSIVTAGHARLMVGNNIPVRVIDLSKAGDARRGPGRAASAPAGAASGAVAVPDKGAGKVIDLPAVAGAALPTGKAASAPRLPQP